MIQVLTSWNPRTGLPTDGPDTTPTEEVEALAARAAAAFRITSTATPQTRLAWVTALADALDAHAEELIPLAEEETALGLPRLTGELAKTATNARYYAAAGASGAWLRAVVETVPGPPDLDLRRAHLPIGPVAVFTASNFPFQFGVIGHDTCSALAVGCPVIVKAHPAQPRLSVRLGEIAGAALAAAGAPEGAFALVHGMEAGLALVDAPAIAAVGFTGSQRGGMALVERSAARPRPIPVYAEMGTVNPVVVTPAAAKRAAEIATGFVDSFTLGVGQFCTKPGLLLAPAGSGLSEAVAAAVASRSGAWQLTAGMADAYAAGVRTFADAGATLLATGTAPEEGFGVAPVALEVALDDLVPGALLEECFGPVALVTDYDTVEQAREVLARLQPSLAASVWTDGTGSDPDAAAFVGDLASQVGRVVVDGWPTGVACADGMQHGGPWPATSRPEASSVGAAALERWTRPVAFQNVPNAALPAALRDT